MFFVTGLLRPRRRTSVSVPHRAACRLDPAVDGVIIPFFVAGSNQQFRYAMRLSISTIILNWNRAALLDDCIRSFVETCPDYDLCIAIDNASTDESSQVIERWCTRDPRIRGMLQPENRGAEWINDAMARITSDLVLILANDKRLLPGWLDYARRVFAAFPEIGQLALHAPAPLDDEVWVTKPAIYRYRGGVGI